MKINYKHRVSEDWLKVRKEHQILTASDFKNLKTNWKQVFGITDTKRSPLTIEKIENAELKASFKEDPSMFPMFAKMWAKKKSVEPLDVYSFNDAARGHWFEKFAIKQFNHDNKETFYHWDDVLVRNLELGIGFSPDAVSFPQPDNCDTVIETGRESGNKYSILEIKCYMSEHHMECCVAKKEDLDERWQIVAAMITDPDIECGNLYFFNPNLPQYSRLVTYKREDLKLEILTALSILSVYNEVKQELESNAKEYDKPIVTEEDVAKEYYEEMNKVENVMKESGLLK
ncbi:MAG: hypothetical protein Q4E88_02815 [Coriobacteriia bacterium]|nr:hypothetical protein [Coriobacteriia bacterium]